MKIIIVVILSFSIIISSCSSTHQLFNFSEIKEDVQGENAIITLKSGDKFEGEIIKIGLDSTFNKIMLLNNNIIIPESEIMELKIIDHRAGAIPGCLGGVLIGGAISAIVISNKKEGNSPFAIFGIGIIAAGVGVAGLIIGLAVGKENNYRSSSSLPNEYFKIEFPLTDQINKDNKFIRIEVLSINEKEPDYIIVNLDSEEFSIPKRYVTKIDHAGDKMFITIPQIIYNLIKLNAQF